MTLTINYKDNEFTCTFTPDGRSSVRTDGASHVIEDVDRGEKETRDMVLDNEDPAETAEAAGPEQEERQTAAENDGGDPVANVSPVLSTPQLQSFGGSVLYRGNGYTND